MENTIRTDISKEQVEQQIKVIWDNGGTNFFRGKCEFNAKDKLWIIITRNKTTFLSSDKVRYIEIEKEPIGW